jgi:uncharacterized SAM-dependent methyltransferase
MEKLNITYNDYLDAKAIIKAFKKNINLEINELIENDFVVKNYNSIKELCFVMLQKNKNIRTIDLAYELKISRQLAHKYKKEYFDSLLK